MSTGCILHGPADVFLPRVVELAMTSGERHTKVAACELLHSLVLYTLGRSATAPTPAPVPTGSRGSRGDRPPPPQPLTPLYRKLFPAVLALACDVEQVTGYNLLLTSFYTSHLLLLV